ncbi:MAG: hypothetical protein NTV79_00800 [Candidatus Aureabacteria bacterium]|nr:hypothetical protein [Candidatus Auribacterota bacterium]
MPWSYPAVSPTVRDSIAVDLNHLRVNVAAEWLALFGARGFVCEARASYRLALPRPPGVWPALREALDAGLARFFPSLAFGLIFALRKK